MTPSHPPSPPRGRLFFGLFPDPAARDAIARAAERLRRAYQLQGRLLAPSRYHTTVHFLGGHVALRDPLVDVAVSAARHVAMPVFDFRLDSASSFRGGRRHPCVLRSTDAHAPVHALWSGLRDALALEGAGDQLEPGFAPHVTLLYDDRIEIEPEPIDAIAWRVREFVLVHSIPGQAEYRILGRWPLSERP